jgi:homoserine dehydrogenase
MELNIGDSIYRDVAQAFSVRSRNVMFDADLILVGFGNVGRRFVRLLDERAREIREAFGIDWRVVAIATGSHGRALGLDGIDTVRAIDLVERGGSLDELDMRRDGDGLADVSVPVASSIDLIAQAAEASRAAGRTPVVVETTVLEIGAGQPAIDHVRAGLRAGAHVITANKGPVAFAHAGLAALARSAGRAFFFEGAVMDGVPIFNMVAATLPAVRISGFSGVLNSTTNFVITAMENGREFAESLAEMQAAGIAEADPSLDVDGWDAAAKAAALANVLMGAGTTPQHVSRSGIGHLSGADVRAAAARGHKLKLVARGRRTDAGVSVQVSVEELPANHLFATLDGQQNALVIETDLLGEFAIVQLGGGLTQTAYALVTDLVAVSRFVPAAVTERPARRGASSRRSPAPRSRR